MEAVIIILKHATFLRLSNMSPESALKHANQDYQEANVDLKIQQHLTASSQEHSIMLSEGFIMATNIGLFILTSVKRTSHQESTCLDILVPSPSPCQPVLETHVHRKKENWFKQVFSSKSTSLLKLRKNK